MAGSPGIRSHPHGDIDLIQTADGTFDAVDGCERTSSGRAHGTEHQPLLRRQTTQAAAFRQAAHLRGSSDTHNSGALARAQRALRALLPDVALLAAWRGLQNKLSSMATWSKKLAVCCCPQPLATVTVHLVPIDCTPPLRDAFKAAFEEQLRRSRCRPAWAPRPAGVLTLALCQPEERLTVPQVLRALDELLDSRSGVRVALLFAHPHNPALLAVPRASREMTDDTSYQRLSRHPAVAACLDLYFWQGCFAPHAALNAVALEQVRGLAAKVSPHGGGASLQRQSPQPAALLGRGSAVQLGAREFGGRGLAGGSGVADAGRGGGAQLGRGGGCDGCLGDCSGDSCGPSRDAHRRGPSDESVVTGRGAAGNGTGVGRCDAL